MAMEKTISASGITKSFHGKTAVDQINFEISKGEIFGFLGPNGAGKTTTLKLLLGLFKPDAGTSTVAGMDSWKDGNTIRGKSGVLFEEPGLYEWMTGPGNMDVFGRFFNIPPESIGKRTAALADLFRISNADREKPVRKLSRGTQKKWGLCRALLAEPEMLFLDEPTANLDPVIAKEVRELIVDLARNKNNTVFMNTHDLDEALKICDQVGIIHHGKLLVMDEPGNLHPENMDYIIRFAGPDISADELQPLNGTVRKYEPGLICISVSEKTGTSPYVKYLVETGRSIHEVSPAENPLEALVASLINTSDTQGHQE